MAPLARLLSLVRNLARSRRIEQELDAELRSYVDLLADEKIAAGLPPERARREARIDAGGHEQVKEQVREVRMGAWVEQGFQDLGYGVRVLRRNPVFTLVAVATLGIGIGANAAIFSVVNAVLLRPLPYAQPGGLFSAAGVSYTGEFVELARRATTVDVAAYNPAEATISGDGEPVRVAGVSVSPGLMPLLGVEAMLGRTLRAGDDQAADGDIVVLSHRFWRGRFGADMSVIGRRLTLDGRPRTIVGVMPPEFAFPSPAAQVWTPAGIHLADRIGLWSTSRRTIARLRPQATHAQAEAELRALVPPMRALFPWNMPADYGQDVSLVPLKHALVADVRPMLTMLSAAVAVVLLIACVNVSSLLVARQLARQRELAIRASLGAGRARILRQVLTEGLLLVLLGVALAVPVAYLGVQLLGAWLPADMPRALSLTLDARLIFFGAGAVAVSALIVGLFPAIRASRVDLVPRMNEGERTGQGRRTRWTSNLLVGTQMALAVMLVVTATLLVRSLANLYAAAPGFAVERIVSARISPPAFRFRDAAARRDLYERVLARVSAVPDVTGAALTDRLPLSGEAFGSVFIIEGRPHPAQTGEWPLADVSAIVSAGWFTTLDIPVLAGRGFTPEDTATSQRVAVVTESLARKYWPGESPLGRRFAFPGDGASLRTIVGVAADVTWERVTDTGRTALFVPLTQAAPLAMRLVVRTSGEEAATVAHVRSIVRDIDRDTPVDQARTMADLVASSVEQPRLAAALVAAFALAGLLLGAIGVYGTVADHVAERRREIGVRMALGAQRRDIFRAVLGGTLTVVVLGAVVGVIAAAAVTRLFAAMLFGITATDPLTFAAAMAILVLTAITAGYVPARRASRVDPLAALRVP